MKWFRRRADLEQRVKELEEKVQVLEDLVDTTSTLALKLADLVKEGLAPLHSGDLDYFR